MAPIAISTEIPIRRDSLAEVGARPHASIYEHAERDDIRDSRYDAHRVPKNAIDISGCLRKKHDPNYQQFS